MVGGGAGAFIGEVHRIAARLDGRYALVAGALSSQPERALESARALGLPADRCYRNFQEMAERERSRPDPIEAVSIVTPNHVHFAACSAFLRAGIPVICDKPLTNSLSQARELETLVRETGLPFALTHNYTGYPLVRHARQLVQEGALGRLRLIEVEYVQDWLATPLEASGQKQASWRTDPAQGGAGGLLGDIGSHAFNLAAFVSGLELESLCAELSTFVPERKVPDNAQLLLRYAGGARGALWCSQVATGNENGLSLRVYGERGGISWNQENPNRLEFSRLGGSTEIVTRAGNTAGKLAAHASRIPSGHPEGYLEGFATLYRDFADQLDARRKNQHPAPESLLVPTLSDGIQALLFIEAALRSAARGGQWENL
jgi:predicted dehydrogenase